MKKNFLIFTALIYLFSIFAELGIFDSFHFDTQTKISSKLDSSVKVLKQSDESKKLVGRNNDLGDCTESTCHTGHCHHISTFSNQTSMTFTDFIEDHEFSLGINYSFQFTRGIKRPPRTA